MPYGAMLSWAIYAHNQIDNFNTANFNADCDGECWVTDPGDYDIQHHSCVVPDPERHEDEEFQYLSGAYASGLKHIRMTAMTVTTIAMGACALNTTSDVLRQSGLFRGLAGLLQRARRMADYSLERPAKRRKDPYPGAATVSNRLIFMANVLNGQHPQFAEVFRRVVPVAARKRSANTERGASLFCQIRHAPVQTRLLVHGVNGPARTRHAVPTQPVAFPQPPSTQPRTISAATTSASRARIPANRPDASWIRAPSPPAAGGSPAGGHQPAHHHYFRHRFN